MVYGARGSGEPGDEVHAVTQYWSKDGSLLAEHDMKWEDPVWLSYRMRDIEREAAKAGAGQAPGTD